MEKSIEFKRQSSEIIKKVVKPLIEKRANLRGDSLSTLLQALSSIDLSTSAVPTELPDFPILRGSLINSLLDMIFLDHAVLYSDAFRIQDEIENIQRIFDSHVGTLMMNVETIATEAVAIKRHQELGISFTKTFHRTPVAEGTTNGFYGVAINSAARKYRLASVSRNYASAGSTTLEVRLLSEQARIIMEGEKEKAFAATMLDPYYVVINSEDEPSNRYFYTDDFSGELGVIISLVLRFSNVVPLTRIRIQPFSNSRVDVLGVYVPNSPGAEWETDVMTKVCGRVTQSSREVELTFSRTYSSEFHVVIRQQRFMTVPENIDVHGLKLEDYLTYAAMGLSRILQSGFTARTDAGKIQEFRNEISNVFTRPSIPVRAGSRLYTIGVSSIIAEDASYNVYGLHESVSDVTDETPVRAAMLFDNNDTLSDNDFVTLGYIKYGGTTYPIVPLGMGTQIRDAIIVPYQESEIYYTFPLNFFIDPNYQLTIRYGGKEKTIPPTELLDYYYNTERNSVLYIPRSVVDETVDIVEGVPIAFRYTIPSMTPSGKLYNPEILDVESVIGNITIDDKCKSYISDHSIYIPINSGEVSVVRIEEDSYRPATLNGVNGYLVVDTKGCTFPNAQVVGESVFVPESGTVGPFFGCYRAIVGEAVSLSFGGYDNQYALYTGIVEYPYVRDSLHVHINGIPATVSEYAPDVSGELVTDNERKEFTVMVEVAYLTAVGDIATATATYIPIPADAPALSTIRPHNTHDEFTLSSESSVTLRLPVYVDPDIVAGTGDGKEFSVTSANVFFLKRDFSVTYEPIIVYANGIKCRDASDYMGSGQKDSSYSPTIPSFMVDPTCRSRIIFDRPITGSVKIDYYSTPVALSGGFMFFHTNPQRESESPSLQWYDVLVDTL